MPFCVVRSTKLAQHKTLHQAFSLIKFSFTFLVNKLHFVFPGKATKPWRATSKIGLWAQPRAATHWVWKLRTTGDRCYAYKVTTQETRQGELCLSKSGANCIVTYRFSDCSQIILRSFLWKPTECSVSLFISNFILARLWYTLNKCWRVDVPMMAKTTQKVLY